MKFPVSSNYYALEGCVQNSWISFKAGALSLFFPFFIYLFIFLNFLIFFPFFSFPFGVGGVIDWWILTLTFRLVQRCLAFPACQFC